MTAYALEIACDGRTVVCDLPLFHLSESGEVSTGFTDVQVEANLAVGSVRVWARDAGYSLDDQPLVPRTYTSWPAGVSLVRPGVAPITYRVLGGEASARDLSALTGCPRCLSPLVDAAHGSGGGYRGVAVPRRVCTHCAAIVLAPDWLSGVEALDSAAVRAEGPLAGTACETCGGLLTRLLLTWGTHEVVVERCPSCGLVVLDPGEAEQVAQLARAMRVDAARQWTASTGSTERESERDRLDLAAMRASGPLGRLLASLASLFE